MFLLCLLGLSLWYAWRYSRIEIDPDWSMFNFAAFTGAWYGRDFLDCKTPAIHLWYWAIAKLVGADVRRVKFAHHILISIPGLIVGGWPGLAFIVLVNSGWLQGFHGNVGQLPAGMFLLAYTWGNPWGGAALVAVAMAFEPKLIPAGVVFLLLNQWWLPGFALAAAGGGLAAWLYLRRRQWWDWLWEANVTITRRMVGMRREIARTTDITYTAGRGLMFILPWVGIGVMERPDWRFWLPAVVYLAFIALGLAVRDNHYLPLAAWIAIALPAWGAALLLITDLVSGLGYLGDIWARYYMGLANANTDARQVGEWLRDRPGRVWVNGLHSGVYIHARKPPLFGLCEQIEIRENASERREVWRAQFRNDPPEWVVVGMSPGWKFTGQGYRLVHRTGMSEIYGRL